MGSTGNAMVGGVLGVGGQSLLAKNNCKVSRTLFLSSPETYLHIFKLKFNKKTALKYQTV